MSDGDRFTDARLADGFTKKLRKAQTKAGRKIGKKFVSLRRRRLGAASSRRKKAVGYALRRYDKGLFFYDMAPMAFSQEFGAVVRPTEASELLVRTGEPVRPGEKARRVGDYLFAGSGQNQRLVGVYKSQVTIPRVLLGQRFFHQAESFVDEYFSEVENEIMEIIL